MKVSDLIDKLSRMDPDTEVSILNECGCCEFYEIPPGCRNEPVRTATADALAPADDPDEKADDEG